MGGVVHLLRQASFFPWRHAKNLRLFYIFWRIYTYENGYVWIYRYIPPFLKSRCWSRWVSSRNQGKNRGDSIFLTRRASLMTEEPPLDHHDQANVGLVEFQDFHYPKSMELESGASLGPYTLRYETYGKLNHEKSNAILIEHALTGNHHAAGKYTSKDKAPGWWDMMIGPGKALDTDRYFIVCVNTIGGCSGSTGPHSINPQTGRPYGLDFPVITIGDMVKSQIPLMEHLGVEVWHNVIGGSMGGMQALHWACHFPQKVKSTIIIASTAAQNAQSIAFSEVARRSIIADPKWNQGNYQNQEGPRNGLSIARMMAHITYLSDKSMRQKFGRQLQDKSNLDFTFDVEFQVESYLRHQGDRFIDRFDANSYLYISKALNYFDLAGDFGGLERAFSKGRSKFLVLSFSSDWLYPSYMSQQLVHAMLHAGREVSYAEIETDYGHDAFLLESKTISPLIKGFLKNI